jgi:hypothetical protein
MQRSEHWPLGFGSTTCPRNVMSSFLSPEWCGTPNLLTQMDRRRTVPEAVGGWNSVPYITTHEAFAL